MSKVKLTPSQRAKALSALHRFMLAKTQILVNALSETYGSPEEIKLARQYWRPSDFRLLMNLKNRHLPEIAEGLYRNLRSIRKPTSLLNIGCCPFCLALKSEGFTISAWACRRGKCPYGKEKGYCPQENSLYCKVLDVTIRTEDMKRREAIKKLINPSLHAELFEPVNDLLEALGMSNRLTLPDQNEDRTQESRT